VRYQSLEQDLKTLAALSAQTPQAADKPKLLTPAQMAALASGLGRKHSVTVTFGDYNTASTDGQNIAIPLTSKENSWITRGFLDHELSHIRLTDLDQIPKSTPLHKTIWNILEDIRVEKEMGSLYPGMSTNFRTLVRELLATNRNFFELPPGSPPDAILAAYIGLVLRTIYLNQPELSELAIATRDQFLTTFGPSLERDLFLLITEIGSAQSTGEVCDLVERIIELLKQHRDKPQPIKNQPNEPDQSEQSQDSQDQTQSTGNTQDEESSADQPDNQQGEQDADADVPDHPDQSGFDDDSDPQDDQSGADNQDDQPKAEAQSKIISNPQSLGLTQPQPEPTPEQDNIAQALNADEEISDFGDQLKDLAQAKERLNDPVRIAIPATKSDLTRFGYAPIPIKASSRVVAQLSTKLQALLQAHAMDRIHPSQSGARIARSRLHRIKTGESKLFLRSGHKKQVATALHLLIDNSASMSEYRRFSITKQVTLALMKALANVRGLSLGASAFPSYYPYHSINGEDQIPISLLLNHEQRSGSSVVYPPQPRGGTPLAEALRFAAVQMIPLTEPRKIVLLLTDGDPDSPDTAQAAIEELTSIGIQLVTLGIGSIQNEHIFPNYQIVQDINDLPQKTFNLLEKLLTA
jgi:cobaltochelatase CobT